MANRIFNDVQIWLDDDGDPLASGKITFYEPGTVTLKNTYTDSSISTAHTNPVILDSNGRPTSPIWLNGEYKYKVTTSSDVAVGLTIDNLNKSTASAVETGLLVTNGSFEVDTNSDGQPDSWTISPLASATIAIDTADSAHGKNSLKFISGGSGGGTATSNRFDALKGGDIQIKFVHKSSSATALTKVDVKTYDKDDILLSTLSAYSEGATNPASYRVEKVSVTADTAAVTAELVITGIDAAGTTITAGTTMNMDGISVEVSESLTLVILDTPEEIAAGALTHDAWTTVDSSTLSDASAVKAILRSSLQISKGTVTELVGLLHVRKTGTSLSADNLTAVMRAREMTQTADNLTAQSAGDYFVNLDSGSDFDYYYTTTASLGADTTSIILVGYYV